MTQQPTDGVTACRAEQHGPGEFVCDCAKPGPHCKPTRAADGVAPASKPSDADVTGAPKLPLTPLEELAIQACNLVKAWAESDRQTPFPEQAHALADGVLMLAAQRRKGVQ